MIIHFKYDTDFVFKELKPYLDSLGKTPIDDYYGIFGDDDADFFEFSANSELCTLIALRFANHLYD
jgi:hypothetical protein